MAKADITLTNSQVKKLMDEALALVANEFSPADHLPPAVYKWLKPIADSTCQGQFATALMFLGGMAPLTNGAGVQTWNQTPTPLMAPVVHIAPPQTGKTRLMVALEELFDTCDDVVAEKVDESLRQSPDDAPVTVKSITLQSFTFPEFFYRCQPAFPLSSAGWKKGLAYMCHSMRSHITKGASYPPDALAALQLFHTCIIRALQLH